MHKTCFVLVLLVVMCFVWPAETRNRLPEVQMELSEGQDESLLIKALQEIGQHRLDSALQDIGTLVRLNPKFKLAQLIYGDLLLAKAQPIQRFGSLTDVPLSQVAALRQEALARWQHYLSHPPADAIPRPLVQLPPTQRHAIVIDLAKARLYVFANHQGKPRLLRDYYITIGKNGAPKVREGDQRTPVGVYFVTGRLSARKLPDLYGAGAFPINYPNEWDRRLGKTGYGIWLHGVPSDTYSRPPLASDGCVALSNPDLLALAPLLDIGHTPVIIAEQVTWVDQQKWGRQRAGFAVLLERWRQDWESRNNARYLGHYSRAFMAQGKDYAAWVRYKRRVNAHKRFLKVALSEVSLFRYPGVPGMMVVTFQQDYRSSNFRDRVKKRQYWRREADGVWRIIYEGPA
jgi:murein L,D-transpeptidase YafK